MRHLCSLTGGAGAPGGAPPAVTTNEGTSDPTPSRPPAPGARFARRAGHDCPPGPRRGVSSVSLAAYRGLLAEPALRRLAIADACARLPQGMVSITLLLVAAEDASMAVAGLVVAGYTLGQAVTGLSSPWPWPS